MVVWRRCSGSCAGQTRDRGRLEFCCRPPRLYGTAWLAHRPCRRTLKTAAAHWFYILGYSVANKQQDCSTQTLSSADKAQSAKHKLPVLSASLTSSVRQVCSTHFRAALHSLYWGRCFRDLENLNIFAHGTYHPLIYTGEEL